MVVGLVQLKCGSVRTPINWILQGSYVHTQVCLGICGIPKLGK